MSLKRTLLRARAREMVRGGRIVGRLVQGPDGPMLVPVQARPKSKKPRCSG